MKKLMILGAGEVQLHLINAAKEFDYFIIVCDMRSDTEAEKLADKFYKINYMDKDAVLSIAKEEKIDGIISNSEPAMISVAFVATAMGLPGNSVESIETLLSKSRFRDLQQRLGAYAPKHSIANSIDEILNILKEMSFPVIIKPTQCSGTRGTTRLDVYDKTLIKDAFEACKEFSRNGTVTVEEYIEMSSNRVNDADVFVLGDKFIWDGWLWEDRSPDTPMLPMTEIYPMAMPEVVKREIRENVENILRGAGIRHGEYNMESYYTPDGKLFVIEINPRQAGNYIPQLIEQHTGVSLTKLLVSTAVGDMSYYEELKGFKRKHNYVTLQVVFAKESGKFKELFIDPSVERYVKWIDQKFEIGSIIDKGINAGEAIAYVDMQFDDYKTQQSITRDIEKYIYAKVDNGENTKL